MNWIQFLLSQRTIKWKCKLHDVPTISIYIHIYIYICIFPKSLKASHWLNHFWLRPTASYVGVFIPSLHVLAEITKIRQPGSTKSPNMTFLHFFVVSSHTSPRPRHLRKSLGSEISAAEDHGMPKMAQSSTFSKLGSILRLTFPGGY